MKEKITNLKQDFEQIYNYLNTLDLEDIKEMQFYMQLDKFEEVISELESLSEDIV